MIANDAKLQFEELLKKQGIRLDTLTVQAGLNSLANFYKTIRAADCDVNADCDMLLVQWGTYDWGKGHRFIFDCVRQFILSDGEDESILQLSLEFSYPHVEALQALGSGNHWCRSLEDVEAFLETIKSLPTYKTVNGLSSQKVELSLKNAG